MKQERENSEDSAFSEQNTLVLETANRVALDILSSQTGVEALAHIAEAARRLVNARYAALGVARPGGQGLSEFVTVGLSKEEEARIGPRPRGLGVLGLLLKRNTPLRIERLAEHPASVGFPPNHPPMQSFLGVPIRRGEQVVGSLYLTDKTGGAAFTEADEIAVEALGAYAAVAIYHLHLLARQRALVSSLIETQEEERRAVAYDLHDGLTQYVMAAYAHLESFRHAHESGKEERAGRELDNGLRYLKQAVTESRRLVNGLRALALDDLGLAGTLEQLVAEEKTRAGWQEADLIHNIEGRRFEAALETTVYRILQEALTNARRHAETSRVRVILLTELDSEASRERLSLEVRDWGCGFDPQDKFADNAHVGLHSMIERVNLMNGEYRLESSSGNGTILRFRFPLLEPKPSEDTQ